MFNTLGCKRAFHGAGSRSLAILATLAVLVLSPSDARAATATECYDPANAQTIGQVGWTGCEGMYIVRDHLELFNARFSGFLFSVNGTDYTFGDGPNRIFTGQVERLDSLFAGSFSTTISAIGTHPMSPR